ncbi:predicted protein [Culex quinquefasciatus]|uniref:Predicted protein n=1 Tax=Culex quinquefasciatus TaxID=7176 RepID=B0WBI1_CULQU|nr:predicted protein [Culex quinquefasciatus]|eukprot:XP_001846065.1 predicted protein [Culex quinquefasciatus]
MFTYAQLVATGGVEAKEESAEDWPQIDPPMDQWPPLVQQDKKCLAMRAFTPATGDKLQIKRGDMITILSMDPGKEWWTGLLNGRTGTFPKSHVLLVESKGL